MAKVCIHLWVVEMGDLLDVEDCSVDRNPQSFEARENRIEDCLAGSIPSDHLDGLLGLLDLLRDA